MPTNKGVIRHNDKILTPRSTKAELWDTLESIVMYEIELQKRIHRLSAERDALKEAINGTTADRYHLTIQLAAMTDKFEESKRTVKRYARLYDDALRTDDCKFNSLLPSTFEPKEEKIYIDFKFMKKTWLEKLFDRFNL